MVKNRWFRRFPWLRLILSLIAILLIFFCIGVIAYGSNSTSNDIVLAILASLAAFFALGQWFFPFSPEKSERLQLPLVHELVRSSFRMGDDAAANFPYITAPIQDTYNVARKALLDASTGTG